MRPEILFPLFADVSTLAGVGAKTKQLFKKLAGDKVLNIIYHLPVAVIDRRNMPDIMNMRDGNIVTAIVQVEAYMPPVKPRDKKSPFKVRCYNETGFLTLVFFNAYPDYLKKHLPIGQKRVVSGKVERFGGEVQIAHPDYLSPVSDLKNITRVEPVYPLTAGIAKKNLFKIIKDALRRVAILPEWTDADYLRSKGWSDWKSSILNVHNPLEPEDVDPCNKHRMRLAYDELFANQLALMLVRKNVNKSGGRSIKGSGILRDKLISNLPFDLTKGQEEVIKEINADQESSERMMRLLQGDVGAGKTVIALMAALNTVECGYQVAIMAPTEILAKQHYQWISEVLEGLDCRIALILGKTKASERAQILGSLKDGETDIIIGTHALFQDAVEFKSLALVIIDEQHRFGVEQRSSLAKKGDRVDVLLMTATPIPRTLTLTMYGDMKCSRLTDKPAGRKEIDTRVVHASKMKAIIDGIWRVIDKGDKIYWICPLIEESEVSDLAAAEERYHALARIFEGRVGLVHGRMRSEDREKAMLEFKNGNIDILVATTVVEVGVDVPGATAIIIEHAERFGLSQLHQLRGRVGRNDKQSSCVLLYHGLGDIAKERLKIMRESNDGFRLAEEDLKLRGGGDVLGTKQSGLPDFKVADLYHHFDLLKDANSHARDIVANGAGENAPALNVLLHLFGYGGQARWLS